MTRKVTQYDLRRRQTRDALWPDAAACIYDKAQEAGFCTLPRTLPLIAILVRHLSSKDPSRVYIDLWFRQRDDGFVEVEDADEMAAFAGHATGTKAVRLWREKLDELQRLGFIRIKPKGNQKYRYILLLHPHDVVARVRRSNPGAIPDWWWDYFNNRIRDIGASLRPVGNDAEEEIA